jgi:hypothetical protein
MDCYAVIDWLMLALSQIDPRILISLQPIFHITVVAHLAYHVHKSGRKTSIIIFHITVMRIRQKMEHI